MKTGKLLRVKQREDPESSRERNGQIREKHMKYWRYWSICCVLTADEFQHVCRCVVFVCNQTGFEETSGLSTFSFKM